MQNFQGLTFTWIGIYREIFKSALVYLQLYCELSFKCCLIHISIIILRHFLYLLYLRPYLEPDLFTAYLCDHFFIFSFIVIRINGVISWIQTHLFFSLFFEYVLLFLVDNMDEECEKFSNSKVRPQSVACHLLDFCQFQPGAAYKSVHYINKARTVEPP